MKKVIYTKEIEVTSTGMIVAKVRDSNGNCKGTEFFSSMFSTNKAIEKKYRKAHKWADDRIAICVKHESPGNYNDQPPAE